MHERQPVCFTLVVDNFGVKYVEDDRRQHLIDTISQFYDAKVEDDARRCLGLTLDWDYEKRKVHLSMSDYVPEALIRFKREKPNKIQTQSIRT